MPKFNVVEVAPALFILLFLVFALLHQSKKKNSKSIDELKNTNPENWKKATKLSAITKLFGWCFLGLIWIEIVALNLSNMPTGNEPIALLMGLLGFFFVAMGIWSYSREIKKIR